MLPSDDTVLELQSTKPASAPPRLIPWESWLAMPLFGILRPHSIPEIDYSMYAVYQAIPDLPEGNFDIELGSDTSL